MQFEGVGDGVDYQESLVTKINLDAHRYIL